MFAGQFYPKGKTELIKEIEKYLKEGKDTGEISELKGCIVPHAGYFYSGKLMASVYSTLPEVDTIIILGTNHNTGVNSISFEDWETPLGVVENDKELGEKIQDEVDIENNEAIHAGEHSIEVQVPFIQYLFPKIKIIPILVADHADLTEGIFRAVKSSEKRVLIVCSSDFSHCGPMYGFEGKCEELDKMAIDKILSLNISDFLFEANQTTICGKEAIALCMAICKKLGSKKVELLDYYTSAKILSGQNKVGYAGVVFY